jgi:aspartyl/asparaginyl-tRNA synthetase
MADQAASAEKPPNPPPAEASAGASGEGEDDKVSKKAANKAAAKAKKEAAKAAAKAQSKGQSEVVVSQSQQQPTEDPAKDKYGRSSELWPAVLSSDSEEINLRSLSETDVGKTVVLRAWLQNVRMQGAKMAFMELREEGNWAIQAVLVVSGAEEKEHVVSKPMVKWAGSITAESFVIVEAKVEKPKDPVKSCRVSDFELHIRKVFVLAAAPNMLGLTLAAANRAVGSFSDEAPSAEQKEADDKEAEKTGIPVASMLTHLDNIAIHKRAPVQQAIADIRMEVKDLFRSYLKSHGFKEFEPPCLIGAASEGGAGVFSMQYFDQKAFLGKFSMSFKIAT